MEARDPKDKIALYFEFIIYFSIVLNIIFIGINFSNTLQYAFLQELYINIYKISIAIYTVELLLRVWACTEHESYKSPIVGRIKFLLKPLIVIDITVIATYLLFGPLVNVVFMRSIRIFKISQYMGNSNDYSPSVLLSKSILNKKEELLITVFGTLITMIICSYLIYFIERNAQPGILNSITPSLKWTFGVLTNSGGAEFQPITTAGKVLQLLMTIIGVLIIGLPLGIITGGFVSEIDDTKKQISLRKNAIILINAFSRERKIKIRKHAKALNLASDARWIDLDFMSSKLQFAPNELFEIIRSSNQLRIRACKTSPDSIYEDNIIVECFPANAVFGVKKLRQSNIHIIATQNYSDQGIGHYSRMLAEAVDSNYYSNEYYSSGDLKPEKRINFSKNADYLSSEPSKDSVFEEWKNTLFDNIKKDDLVIYIGTAGAHNKGDFHVLCGGPKGDYDFVEINNPTFGNINLVSKFYSNLKETFDTMSISIVKQNNFPNTDEIHCSRALRNKIGANVITIYVNTRFLQFTDPNLYYDSIRIIADEILNTLNSDGEPNRSNSRL